MRELARELKEAPQLVYGELVNLENCGFLASFRRGNQRIFMVNQKFALKNQIFALFLQIEKIQNMEMSVSHVYDWKDLKKKYEKIEVGDDLKTDLSKKRKKPRAYAKEKLLKQKNLL